MSRVLISVFLLLVVLSSVANATFVRLQSAQPVCFMEDVSAASEVVVVEYSRPSISATNDADVYVKAKSPYSKTVVYTGKIRPGQGTFTFKPNSMESGEYEICISLMDIVGNQMKHNNNHVDVGLIIDHHSRRVSLAMPDPGLTRTKVGKDKAVMMFTDNDGNQMETLRSVEFLQRVGNLLDDIRHATKDIDEEVDSIMSRGSRMRITSESLFSRVWTFALLTLIAMAAVGYMQYSFLTTFLKRKKLV